MMENQPSLYDLLKTNHIFKKIDEQSFFLIEDYLYFKALEKDEFLFHEGDKGDFMACVVAGYLRVTKTTEDGKEKVLAMMKTGDSIGDMALLDEGSRSATAQATEHTGLVVLSKENFENILVNYPYIGVEMLKGIATQLSVHLRNTSQSLTDAMNNQ